MINSRKIEDLRPEVAEKCEAFIAACEQEGIDVIITSTYRDDESQSMLYAQGRTIPGAKVTNAKAGHSFHNFRVAFDFVPVVSGKAVWNDFAVWKRCGRIGEELGLEWGGSWTGGFIDKPHMQLTGGKSLAEFRSEA